VRIFWGIVGTIAAFIFILVVFRPFSPTHIADENKTALDPASRDAILDAPIPNIAKEAILAPPSSSTASSVVDTSSAKPLLEDDARLRGFDEL
jgi:hypothetical protein